MKKLVIVIFASFFMTSCATMNEIELSVFGLDHYGMMGYTEAGDNIYNLNYYKNSYDEVKIPRKLLERNSFIKYLEPPMGMGDDKKLLYDKKSIKKLSENYYEINLLMVNNAFTLDIRYDKLKPSDTWTNLQLSCPVDRLQIKNQVWFYDHTLTKYANTYDASHWVKENWWHPVNRYAEITMLSLATAYHTEGFSFICTLIEDHLQIQKTDIKEIERNRNSGSNPYFTDEELGIKKKKKISKEKEVPIKFDTKKASETCLDLGFKKGTKKYKNCIIELL